MKTEKYAQKSKEGKNSVNKQTIELNGQLYDAVSGELVSQMMPVPSAAEGKSTSSTAVHRKTAAKVAHNHVKAHAQQSSKTLMRQSVKRPQHNSDKYGVQIPVVHKPGSTIAVKHTINTVNPQRLQRAKTSAQSAYVQKFNSLHHIPVTLSAIPVQPVPSVEGTDAPVAPPPIQPDNTLAMFEHAVRDATHYVDISMHKKHFGVQRRKHAVSMASGFAALMLIAGFLTFQNSPGLQVGAAGMKVGVTTAAPDFKTLGFTYTGVTTHDSKRIVGFKDAAHTYQLTQEKTNWSGESMIRSVSSTDASGTANYQTSKVGDNTVYTLSNGSTMWVKNGVWYSLSANDGTVDSGKLQTIVQNT